MSESKLIRVSTYARRHNLSVQAVYNKIAKGEIYSIKIDGVIFIRDLQ